MKTQIKKLKILVLLIVSATVLTSCSKDDDEGSPEPTTAELLANKWYVVQLEDTSTTPPTIVVGDACEQNSYFDFLDDGYLIVESFNLDMNSNCISDLASFTYDLSDDGEQIYLTGGTPPNTIIVTIETLTETELVIITTTMLRYIFVR